jgi:ArsR family transcriptional regulator
MNIDSTVAALAALANATRLEAFRSLVRSEPDGMPAGDINAALSVPQSTMSAHLSVLERAGLVRTERRSRSIIYRADIDALRGLMLFLAKDCCQGRAELCEPLLAELTCC